MYSDVEVTESVDEDFLNALALLHSSDEGSAERLRNMLNASIDKKSSRNFVRETTTTFHNYSTGSSGIVREFEDQIKLMETSSTGGVLHDRNSSFSSNESIVDYNSLGSSEMCTTDDSFDDEDIPRISIPDEATGDGNVCKICNGDKLGPLILLECQECQDLYHPLCHQPPVVDIDVYDPRLVWRCGKCIEMSDKQAAALILAIDERGKISGGRVGSTVSSKLCNEKLGKEELTEQSCFRRTRSRSENHVTPLKRISGVTHKNSSISMRKRVGSRLSVTRASPAK